MAINTAADSAQCPMAFAQQEHHKIVPMPKGGRDEANVNVVSRRLVGKGFPAGNRAIHGIIAEKK